MPKVSIIVPVHNTEHHLKACVGSLTAQSLTDIEIILVENRSTDNSLALCHELAKSDNRIKVLSINKADLSTARNEGVKVATGEYVGFVDSDDTVLPELFKDTYDLATQHSLELVCFSPVKVFDNRADRYLYPEDGTVRILSPKEMTTLMPQQVQGFIFVWIIGLLKYRHIIHATFMQISVFIDVYRIDFHTDISEIFFCDLYRLSDILHI